MGTPGGEQREKEEIFKVIMAENSPKLMMKHQTTDPGSSENIQKNKSPIIYTLLYHTQTARSKNEEEILKEVQMKKHLTYIR